MWTRRACARTSRTSGESYCWPHKTYNSSARRSTNVTDDVSPLGQRLRSLIKAAGYKSRNAFLKELRVDWITYRRWEKGTYVPGAEHLLSLSKLLHVSV